MQPGTADFYQIPGVAVADSMLRIRLADGDQAVDPQPVAEKFHCLGNALADANPLLERPDDLMGILFLQFVIGHIFQDKIMDALFLLLRHQFLHGPEKPGNPPLQRFLMFFDLFLLKKVFRNQMNVVCLVEKAIGKTAHIENRGMVQPEPEKNLRQLFSLQPKDREFRRQRRKAIVHSPVNLLFFPVHLLKIVFLFHSFFLLTPVAQEVLPRLRHRYVFLISRCIFLSGLSPSHYKQYSASYSEGFCGWILLPRQRKQWFPLYGSPL